MQQHLIISGPAGINAASTAAADTDAADAPQILSPGEWIFQIFLVKHAFTWF